METWVESFKNCETHDFDPEVLAKLNAFLKVMIRQRIEFTAAEVGEIEALSQKCLDTTLSVMARASALISLIMPCPEFKWDPLPILRILAKLDPTLQYLHLVPSKLTYGHHGLYMKFRDHYIILLTNYPKPLIYTQNVFNLSPDLKDRIETVVQLLEHHRGSPQMLIFMVGYEGHVFRIRDAYGKFLDLVRTGDKVMLSVPEGPPLRPRYVEE
jgi:hypothetical protein